MKVHHRASDFVQRLGRGLGLHITRAENTLPFKRQRFLAELGIDLVLDIGANVGHYAQELRAQGWRGRTVSFEPIAHVYRELQARCGADAQWRGLNLALGDADGEAQINVSHNDVSSSLLKVTANSVDAAGATAIKTVETIRVARLDGLAAELQLRPQDRLYAKVDVQGFERQVLQGAAGLLPRLVALELELSLVELYAGQALMPEMMQLAASLGYRPAWLERGFKDPRNGWLLQMDGIFVREDALR